MSSNSGLSASLTSDSGEQLVGSRCNACAAMTFPLAQSCPNCGSGEAEAIALPREGTVWTWTVQRFRPKDPFIGPQHFEPYAVGYVDLGEVKVEARLAGKAVNEWRIGEQVCLRTGPLHPDDSTYQTFWFEPVQ